MGVRHVLNPGQEIEVSVFGAVGSAYTHLKADRTYVLSTDSTTTDDDEIEIQHSEASGITVEAVGGIAFEHPITKRLAVRLSAVLVNASWSQVQGSNTIEGEEPMLFANSGPAANLAFRPELELRLWL